MTRKRLSVLLGVICLAGLACLAWQMEHSEPRLAPRIHFVGYTNGVIGKMGLDFEMLSPQTGMIYRDWLKKGTNSAVLRVTNPQNRPLTLFPISNIEFPNSRVETPLLSAPDFNGLKLQPHETREILVAMLAQPPHCRISVSWAPEFNPDSMMDTLRRLVSGLGRFIHTGRRGVIVNYTPVYSEWITE